MYKISRTIVVACLLFPGAIFGMKKEREAGEKSYAAQICLRWKDKSTFEMRRTADRHAPEYTFYLSQQSIKKISCPCKYKSRSFDAYRPLWPLFTNEKVTVAFERKFSRSMHCTECYVAPTFATTYDWRGPALLAVATVGVYYRKEIAQKISQIKSSFSTSEETTK